MNHKSLVKTLAREFPTLNPYKIDALAHRVEGYVDDRLPAVRMSINVSSTPFAPKQGSFYTHFQLTVDGVTVYGRAEFHK